MRRSAPELTGLQRRVFLHNLHQMPEIAMASPPCREDSSIPSQAALTDELRGSSAPHPSVAYASNRAQNRDGQQQRSYQATVNKGLVSKNLASRKSTG